ncbi:MAG: hypothetical protein NTW79_02395 [Candidatus Berkelbacteria bacterium]|nr:hypothetical protein [Candidatus Berkelbacteria bacterium]
MLIRSNKIFRTLCVFLAFNFAILLPTSPMVARAITIFPPSAPNATLAFQFLDTAEQNINVQLNGVTTPAPSFTFAWQQGMTGTFASGSAPTLNGSAVDSSNIFFYQLATPNESCKYSTTAPVYLVVFHNAFGSDMYFPAGIYTSASATANQYSRIGWLDLAVGGVCHGLSPNTQTMAQTANSAGYQNTLVKAPGTPLDQCNQLGALWKSYVDNFKALFSGDPSTNTQYWVQSNGVITNGAVAGAITSASTLASLAPGGQLASIFLTSKIGAVQTQWANYKGNYQLNDAGNTLGATMEDQLQQMINLTTSLSSQSNTWPAGCDVPKELNSDWTFSSTPFPDPAKFNTYLADMAAFFANLKATYNTTAGTSGDICGNMFGQNGISGTGIWNWMFCWAGVMAHEITSTFLTAAVALLNSSIGLDIQFQTPAIATPESSSSSPAPSSTGASTPAIVSAGTPTTTGTALDDTTLSQAKDACMKLANNDSVIVNKNLNGWCVGFEPILPGATSQRIDKCSTSGTVYKNILVLSGNSCEQNIVLHNQ